MENIFEDKFDERYVRAVRRRSDQGLENNPFIKSISKGTNGGQKTKLLQSNEDPDIKEIAELLNKSMIKPVADYVRPRIWSQKEHKRLDNGQNEIKSPDESDTKNDKDMQNGQRKSLSSIYDTASRGYSSKSATPIYCYNDYPPTSPNSSFSSKSSKTSDNIIEALQLSPRITPRELLKILEIERKEKIEKAVNDRQKKFKAKLAEIEERNKQELARKQSLLKEDMLRQQTAILEANNTFEYSTGQAQIKQVTENAAERVRQSQEILKEKERQKQVLGENIRQIVANQKNFYTEFQQIIGLTKTCVDNTELRSSKEVDFNIMKTLPLELEPVLVKCRNQTVTENDVQISSEILDRLIEFKNKLKSVVDNINEKKQQEEDEKKRLEQLRQQQLLEEQNAALAPQPAIVSEDKPDSVNSNDNVSRTISKLSKYVVMTDLHRYTEIMDFYQQYRQSFSIAENDPRFKQLKFDFNKAVNTPLNSLSGVNAEHIMDKYRKLHGLLSGQSVIVNNKQVNATSHPQGIPYCTDLLARKFVLQGDLMVSSNPESAFCYGTMILTLWNDFPDFGKLILAYFYNTCPYLVPYYIPKQEGDTDEEFYKKLGYQYSEGEVEKQDKFLKRMTGIMTLFFATMISKPKKGQSKSPLTLKDGWTWLASFLKLQPQLDITATALHTFLETVGFEMDTKYGKVFQKVLRIISQVFLPKCKEAKCTGGAVTRLELLLNDYVKKREFPKPNGYVSQSYW